MNITIIGTGYVGLVSGTCFAEMGNQVVCVDRDEAKIAALKNNIMPIYEPGLKEMVGKNVANSNLVFSTSLKDALASAQLAFIAVGTPMGEDGHADLSHVLNVAREIGATMTRDLIVVDKSTVPVGTAQLVREAIREALNQRGASFAFDVVSNPEFLKEGAAINDFMHPDRVVIGADSSASADIMKELYRPFTLNHERTMIMDVRSAEMTKYAANAMLATKISFINEIANICERVGANVNAVRLGVGADSRIGYKFIYPGCGYGGSCFPKDVRALLKTAEHHGYHAELLSAVENVNTRQKSKLFEKLVQHFAPHPLNGKHFGIWGLAFKPETDDMRDAPSLALIHALINAGATISVFDPQAMQHAREFFLSGVNGVTFATNKYDALNHADAMVLVTEWKEFRSPDFFEIKSRLKTPVILDGRNQYNTAILQGLGITHIQIGV